LTVGVTDPIAFLDKRGLDWDIQCAVIREAQSLQAQNRQEELKALVDAIGKSVGSRVGQTLAKMFR
jgi:hypothetical protein